MNLTDEEIEEITNDAYTEYRKWSRGIRGQTITYMDGIEFWVIKSTLRFVDRKNAPCKTCGGTRQRLATGTTTMMVLCDQCKGSGIHQENVLICHMWLLSCNSHRWCNKDKGHPEGRVSEMSVHGGFVARRGGPGKWKLRKCWRGLIPGEWNSGQVQRACATGTRSFQGVEVNHGGFHAGVAQQVLDGADVGAGRQEMGCEGMPQAM